MLLIGIISEGEKHFSGWAGGKGNNSKQERKIEMSAEGIIFLLPTIFILASHITSILYFTAQPHSHAQVKPRMHHPTPLHNSLKSPPP